MDIPVVHLDGYNELYFSTVLVLSCWIHGCSSTCWNGQKTLLSNDTVEQVLIVRFLYRPVKKRVLFCGCKDIKI